MRPGSIEELNERYMPKPDDPLYSWVRQMFPCPFIVVLDHNSDDDEEEESTWYPPPSERPKKPLPKNFGRNHRSPVKDETAQGVETPSPEEHHTISCAPAVRGKSLEELQVATGEPPKPVSGGVIGIPPVFTPWRESEGDGNSSAGQVESSKEDVSMDVDN